MITINRPLNYIPYRIWKYNVRSLAERMSEPLRTDLLNYIEHNLDAIFWSAGLTVAVNIYTAYFMRVSGLMRGLGQMEEKEKK